MVETRRQYSETNEKQRQKRNMRIAGVAIVLLAGLATVTLTSAFTGQVRLFPRSGRRHSARNVGERCFDIVSCSGASCAAAALPSQSAAPHVPKFQLNRPSLLSCVEAAVGQGSGGWGMGEHPAMGGLQRADTAAADAVAARAEHRAAQAARAGPGARLDTTPLAHMPLLIPPVGCDLVRIRSSNTVAVARH